MNLLWENYFKMQGGCIVEHIETGSLMFLPDLRLVTNLLKILVT